MRGFWLPNPARLPGALGGRTLEQPDPRKAGELAGMHGLVKFRQICFGHLVKLEVAGILAVLGGREKPP